MASTTAMYTALSGMIAASRSIDVIGNNVANVNTTAFKSSRTVFADQIYRTLDPGSAPSANTGGTNPKQVGLGVGIAGTQRNFNGGSIATSGDARDLAIEGDGLFVVRRDGTDYYTRAGAFRPNAQDELSAPSGERLMGYSVDDNFQLATGQLAPLAVPLGKTTIAEATRNVRLTGNLNAGGEIATTGSRVDLPALALAGGATGSGNVLEASSLLTEISDPTDSTRRLFDAGESLRLSGAEKGGKLLPDAALAVTTSTTVQQLLDFLASALAIDTASGTNTDGVIPGAQLDPATGVISVVSNAGRVNELDIEARDLQVLNAAGDAFRSPLKPTKVSSANGESVRTTFVGYDSLGAAVTADVSLVLADKNAQGTTWRYYLESADDTDGDLRLASGNISFDSDGRLLAADPLRVTINRQGTGAADPLELDLSLRSASGEVTALADVRSSLAAVFQDGSPIGTLSSFGIGADGLITGTFSNGQTRTMGQVVLAKFANNQGLISEGQNLFSAGPDSGSPAVNAPGVLGTGRIVAGALESANVDLSQEFTNLILASTMFSASSRVITTNDQLLQQLLVLGR
ncbi:MAG: flagellar hook-basal body complex protein [Phycisphaerae bacterium]|nr:flagellar hook-basal body complex protein [Phycisphaerae bacterium]